MKLAINEIKKNKENKEKENDATDWKSLLAGIYMINLKQKDRTIKIHKFDKLEVLKRQIFRYARWGMGRSNQDQIDDKDDFIG